MIIAVDTGGTKTLVASFDSNGKSSEQFKFPTPVEPSDYIEQLSDFLIKHYDINQAKMISLGIPGTMLGGVCLKAGNLPWSHFDVVGDLREALEAKLGAKLSPKIVAENDANLAGLAEARALKTMPPVVLYVTVSTGVGTGVITDGHINEPLSRGEGGYIQVEWQGKPAMWQDVASGKAVFKRYHKFARDITSKRAWDTIALGIGRGLLNIIPIIRPDVIIIGGSIGTYFDKYERHLEQIIHHDLPDYISSISTPVILPAKHPEQAVIFGCYYYAHDKLAR